MHINYCLELMNFKCRAAFEICVNIHNCLKISTYGVYILELV